MTAWYPQLRHLQRRRERNEHHDRPETRLGGRISHPSTFDHPSSAYDKADSLIKTYLKIAGRSRSAINRMIRLTDEQWERIRSHFPEEHIADGRPGRKPIPTRRVLEAVLWLLNTGAQWHMLPQSYPNYKTVHRRFQAWCRDEILRRLLTDVANELRDRGALDEEECFIDATFVMAKGGGAEIGATKRGKGMKIMAIVDRHGLPLSVLGSMPLASQATSARFH